MKKLTTRQVHDARTPQQATLAKLVYNLPEIQEDYNRLIGEAGEAGRGQMAPSAMYHHELEAYGIPSTENGLIEPSAEIEGNLALARRYYKVHGSIAMLDDMVEWAEGRTIAQVSESKSAASAPDILAKLRAPERKISRKHLDLIEAGMARNASAGARTLARAALALEADPNGLKHIGLDDAETLEAAIG